MVSYLTVYLQFALFIVNLYMLLPNLKTAYQTTGILAYYVLAHCVQRWP